MKRLIIFILVFTFVLATASADIGPACDLSVSLLNQDPYPAIPGSYVKLVFQINGLENPNCGDVTFQLLEKYPIALDESTEKIVSLNSGTFVRTFSSYATVAFQAIVDENALGGENAIETKITIKGTTDSYEINRFNLSVEKSRASFEVYVKDFDSLTNEITFEILNIADFDVSAVTLELLDSESLKVYGSKTRIVGDLDSNEYTTSDFTIAPINVEIPIKILYTDSAGIRRSTQASVKFNPTDFESAVTKSSSTKYWIIAIIIVVIGFWLYRRKKNKKRN